MLISCNGFYEEAINIDNRKKMVTLDGHPLVVIIHPKTLRISLAIDVRRWKNVSVTRSAPKTRRERALDTISLQAHTTWEEISGLLHRLEKSVCFNLVNH